MRKTLLQAKIAAYKTSIQEGFYRGAALLLSDRARPLRFVVTGGIAGISQLALLALMTYNGWQPLLANTIAFLLAAQINFVLGSLFTWWNRPSQGASLLARWLAFHGSILGTTLLNLLVFTLAHVVLSSLLASALGIVAAATLNFIVQDRHVFRATMSSKQKKLREKDNARLRPVRGELDDDFLQPTQKLHYSGSYLERNTRMIVRKNSILTSQVSQKLDAPTYSIVAPVFNEEETLPRFYERVITVMEEVNEPFELLLINDGSSDGSYREMQELHTRDARVHVINFSRNFGHQIAISAGLDYARGGAVIILDADLQDPPEIIPTLIQRWKDGAEVVYAQRTHREGETKFKLLTATLFYRLIAHITTVRIPRDTGDFRLLDRRVVDTLVKMREQHRFMRGLSAWVGFRQEAVPYERHERFAGTTKYPLSKMIHFSLDAITSFSHVPLQLATSFGFILAGMSLVGILVAILLRLLTGAIVGQASTLILVLFLGGIQLIFLGILGEYLGRIYDEVRARPLYIVRDVLD